MQADLTLKPTLSKTVPQPILHRSTDVRRLRSRGLPLTTVFSAFYHSEHYWGSHLQSFGS
jgi:hypothetical protein